MVVDLKAMVARCAADRAIELSAAMLVIDWRFSVTSMLADAMPRHRTSRSSGIHNTPRVPSPPLFSEGGVPRCGSSSAWPEPSLPDGAAAERPAAELSRRGELLPEVGSSNPSSRRLSR